MKVGRINFSMTQALVRVYDQCKQGQAWQGEEHTPLAGTHSSSNKQHRVLKYLNMLNVSHHVTAGPMKCSNLFIINLTARLTFRAGGGSINDMACNHKDIRSDPRQSSAGA